MHSDHDLLIRIDERVGELPGKIDEAITMHVAELHHKPSIPPKPNGKRLATWQERIIVGVVMAILAALGFGTDIGM